MLIVILSAILTITASESTDTLNTTLGLIKFVTTTVDDGNMTYDVRNYRNIPYAKAPVGELRFKQPIPFGKWTGVRDGTEFGPSCIQPPPGQIMSSILPNHNQSEDCLQLNIYSPLHASSSNKKSVMVWIHGGAYTTGQGMVYDGSYLAGVGDVVVVTINYRLNVFGFLSTMNDLSPGNYGLWDQQLALQWVHNNIGDYGGDSNSITIFGESAGGFSVGLQALNPSNKGLFQRVIAQSGVGNSFLATSPIPTVVTQIFANFTNCPMTLTAEAIQCLRNKTSEELLQGFLKMGVWVNENPELHIEIGFAPVVDNSFMTVTPQDIISGKGDGFKFYSSLDVLIGNCESEGSLLVGQLKSRNATQLLEMGIPLKYLCKNIISTVVSDYYNNETQLIPFICDQYNTTTDSLQGMSAVNFYGDIFFYSPTVKSLISHASGSEKSHFQYLSKRHSIFSVSQRNAKWFSGAGHASELPFLFPYRSLSNATNDDRTNSILLIKYWSNFAKTGNVNGDGVPNWPQFDKNNQSYAVLDVNVTIQTKLYRDRVNFWLQTLPNHIYQTTVIPSKLTTQPADTSEPPTISPTPKPKDGGNGTLKCTFNVFAIILTMIFQLVNNY